MRKNKGDNKRLKLIYITYEIKGLNLDRLINVVQKRGITLYDVKKPTNKRLILSVNFKENKKFFAITKELCYNVKKVGEGGWALPMLKLIKNFGFVVGAVFFMAISILSNNYVFAIAFTGTGSVIKREVEQYLTQTGIGVCSRFSDIDLAELEDGILASNKNLSFVSCKKVGNRLCIELVLSKSDTGTLKGDEYKLLSNVSGTVEQIKVYRGTAEVRVGDVVNEGDLLVDGYALIRDQRVETNVIASVTILTKREFYYRSEKDGEEEKALLFAEESLGNKEVLNSSVTKTEENGVFIYKTELLFRCVISAG